MANTPVANNVRGATSASKNANTSADTKTTREDTTLDNNNRTNPLDTNTRTNESKEERYERLKREILEEQAAYNASLNSVDITKEYVEGLKEAYDKVNGDNLENNTFKDPNLNKVQDGKITNIKHISSSKINHLYINGMMTSYDEALNDARDLLNNKPGNTALLYNGTSKNILNDGSRVLAGRVLNKLGDHCEKAVSSLKDYLKEKLETGEQINLYAHSQGAVIIQNALGLLKKEFTESDFEKLKAITTITLFGAASYDMNGFKTTGFVNKDDFIPGLIAGNNEQITEITNNNPSNKKISNIFEEHSIEKYKAQIR